MNENILKLIENEISNNRITWHRIEDICKISRGRVISKSYVSSHEGIYPVYSSATINGGVFGMIDTYDYDDEYVTWTTDGDAGTVFYRSGKFSITNISGLLKVIDENISVKYLSYIFSMYSKRYVNTSSDNPKLMSNIVAKISLPFPSLKIQNKIVSI
ncbi:type I restriction endonuclease subunit S, partial [Mycoplasmopsis agassizii]